MKPWLALLLAVTASAEVYQARHDHLRGSCDGRLRFDDEGVEFESETKKKHSWKLTWLDIQQIRLLDNGDFRLLTYQDRRWMLGADREYKLHVSDTEFPSQMTPQLEKHLGRRFVAGLVPESKALWELPAKHLLRFTGAEGSLIVTAESVLFRSPKPGSSRAWALSDIDSVSSNDALQLTLVTYEHARSHYGDRKSYNFLLKQPLDPTRYNQLWRALEQAKGLDIQTLSDEKKYAR